MVHAPPSRVGLILVHRHQDLLVDAAIPACYLALLAPMIRSARGRLTVVAAVGVALVTTPFVPVGAPVLIVALVVIPIALLPRQRVGS